MNAIEVKNVYKSFKIYYDKGATLKERIIFKKRNRFEEHQVLKGIDLTIKKGEVIGLIGENGCGKSTLLKLMTRIIYPDKGTISINGKVSSLLELGAGFHPDMSGRENIYTNASIFGLTKREIDKRIEEIIAFSELEEFIDNPVRTYSSGMYMRLAFSVAINVDAEILLVDEILAVGDAAFQAKCFNKMQEIKNEGTTIVIVSHDLNSIERLCDRAVWINKGVKEKDEKPHDVVAYYLDNIMNKAHIVENEAMEENEIKLQDIDKESNIYIDKRTGNKYVEIINVRLLDNASNNECDTFKTGQNMIIEIKYKKNEQALKDSVVGIGVFRNDNIHCYGSNSLLDNNEKIRLQDEGIVYIDIQNIPLLQGEYILDIAFHSEEGIPYDYIREIKRFNMYSEAKDIGLCRLKHTYRY